MNYDFVHHDALEDAKACGHVLQRALSSSDVALDEWVSIAKQPIPTERVERSGPLAEYTIVFTGSLEMSRAKASTLATGLGASVSETVNTRTTHLVVGDQDLRQLAGHEKSRKHRKAEELIAAGAEIQIVQESDFLEWVSCQ